MSFNLLATAFDDGCTPGERVYLQHLDNIPSSLFDRDWAELPDTAKEHWDSLGEAHQRTLKDASKFDPAEYARADRENMGGRRVDRKESRRKKTEKNGMKSKKRNSKHYLIDRVSDLAERRKKEMEKKKLVARVKGLSDVARRVRDILEANINARIPGYAVRQQEQPKIRLALPLPQLLKQLSPTPLFPQAFGLRVVSRPTPEPISPIAARGPGTSWFPQQTPQLLASKPAPSTTSVRELFAAPNQVISPAIQSTTQTHHRDAEPILVASTFKNPQRRPLRRILYVPAAVKKVYQSPYPPLQSIVTQTQSTPTISLESVASFHLTTSNFPQPSWPTPLPIIGSSSNFVPLPRSGSGVVPFNTIPTFPPSDRNMSISGSIPSRKTRDGIQSEQGPHLTQHNLPRPSENRTASSMGLVLATNQTPSVTDQNTHPSSATDNKLPPFFLFALGGSRRL
ncbi:hypothetical protein WAI453_004422 [Rhynchosporium graminicola]|uniref:Uncharacterized protein n=1 Tax=Rhynchosporium graminicola TaxID=2792576 RepID=A0A1E1L5M5_9HELO|nr:uncharacterized protein RCO7_03954 [Rhynchosporium commune]